MDRLHAMKVFTRVVDAESFTRAAGLLNLPRASVTVIIQNLEAHLKVRLLQRTTRQLSLTADGAAYYERCILILADIDETENLFLNVGRAPRGKLRVDVPGALGRMVVMPKIREFQARYPEIELLIGFGDKPVDLVQEGVDCVVRVGHLEDSTLVARRIGTYQAVTVASPEYLERHGVPTGIDDLQRHKAVNYFWGSTGRTMDLTFVVSGEPVRAKLNGSIAVNDAEAYVVGGLEGLGIIQAARFMALPHLRSGKLVEILSDWKPLPLPISAVYPQTRHLSPSVRAFVDWVAYMFADSALLSGDSVQRNRREEPVPGSYDHVETSTT
jgi:LysR family transcriptional regulator for bpeEF and oprC